MTTRKLNSVAECIASLGENAFIALGGCNGTWDTVLCWPAAKFNATITKSCPPLQGSDTTKLASRTCGPLGIWLNKYGASDSGNQMGWTDYTTCFPATAIKIWEDYFRGKTEEEKRILQQTINGTRILEMVGLVTSLLSIIISLIIFCYFKSLMCNRVRIHVNLFIAILIQTSVRLVIYVNGYLERQKRESSAKDKDFNTLYQTEYLCEFIFSLLQFGQSAMFVWMLVEGIYLHYMVALSSFNEIRLKWLYVAGWGLPLLLIIVWVTTMVLTFPEKCWYGYNTIPQFWILQGPRWLVIALNALFLLNIIRVLVTKLRESQTNEVEQARKAVKAAVVLLPLLGITNLLSMFEAPHQSVVGYAAWAVVSHFLMSFQGFFISLLYCFLNAEVRITLKRHFYRCVEHHFPNRVIFRGNYDTSPKTVHLTMAATTPNTDHQREQLLSPTAALSQRPSWDLTGSSEQSSQFPSV